VPDPLPFVDVHCHLLPAVDDGSTGWDETLAMARLAVADGISTVVVTPHQLGRYSENHGEAIRSQTAQLQQFLDQRGVSLQVLPGGDVRIEPDMALKIQRGEVLTLADRHKHVLLELPHEIYLPLDRILSDLSAIGVVGILSHPERNQGILRQRDVVFPLVRAGCLMQVTAGALVGTFGPHVQKLARWLVTQRLVHFVATDAHGAKARRPLMRRAFDCVSGLVGDRTAVELCCRNPALVAAGEDVRASRGSRLSGWFAKRAG